MQAVIHDVDVSRQGMFVPIVAHLEKVFCCPSQGRDVSQKALPQTLRNAINFWFCYCKRIYWSLFVVIPALKQAVYDVLSADIVYLQLRRPLINTQIST